MDGHSLGPPPRYTSGPVILYHLYAPPSRGYSGVILVAMKWHRQLTTTGADKQDN